MRRFQEVSFFFLMCGGPGAGKSMRAKRLQVLLADGWIKGSGSSSAKAGMNGGVYCHSPSRALPSALIRFLPQAWTTSAAVWCTLLQFEPSTPHC